MAKITHVIDGKEVELDLEGVLTQEEVNESYVPRVKFENETRKFERLLTKARETKVEELLHDAAFREQAITAWGLPKDGGPSPEQVAQLTDGIRSREVKPLEEQNSALMKQLTEVRSSVLRSDLTSAARAAGVREELLTPLVPGKPAPIVAILEQSFQFGFDDERKGFMVVGEDGQPVYADKPTPQAPYKSPTDAVMEWAKSKQAASFLAAQRPNVPGPGGGNPPIPRSGSGMTVPNDPLSIGRNLEAIAKGEVKVNVAS